MKEGEGERYIEDQRYKNTRKFYSYFSENEIKNLLKSAGFAVIDFEIFYDTKEKYRNTGIIYLIAKKIR